MNSVIIAFAMYSKLPMPKVDWSEENMQYAMCYFPWIGAIIGILYVMVFSFWKFLPCDGPMRNVIMCVIPLLITGGIHLDGYIDTIDARHSYQSRERKLEILKDPNVGAFAVIWTIIYFMLMYGFSSEVSLQSVWVIAIGFVYSRSLSGFSVVSIKSAREDGLLASFASAAKPRHVKAILFTYIVFCVAGMVLIDPVIGGLSAAAGMAVYLYYRRMAMKEFGGVTGDLAGYFLQCCELGVLAAAVAGDKLTLFM